MFYFCMKTIPLTQGKVTIVDDEDFDELNKYKWCISASGYAVRNRSRKIGKILLYMAKEILPCSTGIVVDHINGNKLDNRKKNLRRCTQAENSRNRHSTGGFSGIRGVTWHPQSRKWRALIMLNGKSVHIGLFEIKEDAGRAYDKKSKELFGEFCSPNF